jgi:hypothetical protein
MSTEIRTIPLDQAEAGMVLASDVTVGGKVLLARGTVLGVAQIGALARREVPELAVLARIARSAAEIEALRAAQERRVQRLFRRAGSDATMQALQRAVREYRLGALE